MINLSDMKYDYKGKDLENTCNWSIKNCKFIDTHRYYFTRNIYGNTVLSKIGDKWLLKS